MQDLLYIPSEKKSANFENYNSKIKFHNKIGHFTVVVKVIMKEDKIMNQNEWYSKEVT